MRSSGAGVHVFPYGKAPADESLRETIRSIVREELAAPSVQLGDLLKALIMVAPPTASSSIRSDEPDDDDLDDDLDSFGADALWCS